MAPVRTLICHGSRPGARRLRELLEADHSVEVVGIAPSGEHALESLRRLRPAVVVMDLDLPGMDAVRAIAAIMRERPVPILALGGERDGGRRAAAALGAGAAETVSGHHVGAALRRKVSELAAGRAAAPARTPVRTLPAAATDVRAIGIGASTGGPRALQRLLAPLPAGYPLPILVVQHIGAGFDGALADWLDGALALPVRVPRDGDTAAPGVWLAPDGAHLTVDASLRMTLSPGGEGGHCPSADVLLCSMADALGSHAAGVVLTGMGADGAAGAGAIVAAGGLAFAQDEASAIVFGMPRAAAARGARTLDLAAMGDVLGSLRSAA